MKKELTINTTQKSWSLATNITYATVPAWYGTTLRDLKCSVCFPKYRNDSEKYPLLIWICGGAFQVMDKDVWMPQWIEFARQGCIVAGIEYREGNETDIPGQLCDVKSAIRYFKANADMYSIDRERIFTAGESAGGTLAALAGIVTNPKYETGFYLEQDSRIQGVIDFYGVTNFENIVDDEEISRIKDEIDVVGQVTSDAPPFLIFQGETDNLVRPEHSEALYEKLCRAGVPADYYLLKNEGHGADAFYQKEIMEIIKKFIKRSMGNHRAVYK